MVAVPKVIIFCDEKSTEIANSIAATLLSEFGIADVTTRLTSSPTDRLLTTIHNVAEESVVFVVLEEEGSSCPSSSSSLLIDLIERESHSPVLSLPASCNSIITGALRIAKLYALSMDEVKASILQHLSSQRQAKLVNDIQIHTKSDFYKRKIEVAFDSNVQITGDAVEFHGETGVTPTRMTGKVRDRYDLGDKLALVTTDRQSGFDRMLAKVPFKVS